MNNLTGFHCPPDQLALHLSTFVLPESGMFYLVDEFGELTEFMLDADGDGCHAFDLTEFGIAPMHYDWPMMLERFSETMGAEIAFEPGTDYHMIFINAIGLRRAALAFDAGHDAYRMDGNVRCFDKHSS